MKIANRLIGNINEKLTVRGTIDAKSLKWIFGRSRFPTAAVGYDISKDEYYLLTFKGNKKFHPSTIFTSDLLPDDVAYNMVKLSKDAAKEGMMKKYHPKLSAEKFLELLVNKEGVNVAYLEGWFPNLKGKQQENLLQAGSFEIVYQNEKEGKAIAKIFEDACKILSKEGYDKICYGRVYSVGTLNARAVADYTENTDTIRVSNKAKKSKEAIRIVIHELGHRLSKKHFSVKDWEIVTEKWKTILSEGVDVKVGDKFIDPKDDKEFEIVDTQFKRDLKYIIKQVGTEGPRFTVRPGFFAEVPITNRKVKKKNPFFVSEYAKTSASEFFSEVFSFAMTTNQKELKDWVKQFKP